jgi:glycosyltransferase involved in cell wall biosynthesis
MATRVPSLAVVMPAFNERGRIGPTLEAICSYAARHQIALPVVVGDDGSADGTGAFARDVAARLGLDMEIVLFPHRGKALTVRDAMLRAADRLTVDYLVMLDADNEISIEQIDHVDWLADPATIYIGRRVATAGRREGARPAPLRRLMSAGMRMASRLLLGLRYPDTQCGFKLFPRILVADLFGQQRSSGWIFDAEILAIADRVSGLPIREVPVTWAPRGASRVRASAAIPSLFAVVAVAVHLWAGRYRPVRVLAATAEPARDG